MDKFLCLLFLCLMAPFSAFKQCQFGQYWSSVLQVCLPCRDVCGPPARPSCWDFCIDVFFQRLNQSNSTTAVTKIMSTTSQPIIADYTFFNGLSPILVAPLLMVGSVVGMFFVVNYVRNTKVRNAHRCRRDVENGNGQQGIELQPLNGTAVQQENDNQDVDENGDGNRDGDASGTWVYEPEYDCPRIRDMETLPQQRAQQPDSLDSLPQQRAQQPDSLERNHNSY